MDPAVVIVPGAWHDPAHYADLIRCIEQSGINEVRCPQLPSAVERLPVPANATLAEDTSMIRDDVQSLTEAGKAVIVLMHSYGGLPGSNALDGLLWSQRLEQGRTGGVVHIVYVAAFVLPIGTNLFTPFGGQVPPFCDDDQENGIMPMKEPRQSFYSDIEDDDEAEQWMKMCVQWPTRIGSENITSAPYDHVGRGFDATYIVTTRDYRLPKEMQEGIASILGEHRAVEYIDSGHVPMVSQPAVLANMVLSAWERSRGRFNF